MDQRVGHPTDPPTRRRRPWLVALATAFVAVPVVACGSSDGLSQDDFETVITESRIGTDVGASTARSYAECLFRETDGEVTDLVDHIDDDAYQPAGVTAAALTACSDVLFDGG